MPTAHQNIVIRFFYQQGVPTGHWRWQSGFCWIIWNSIFW